MQTPGWRFRVLGVVLSLVAGCATQTGLEERRTVGKLSEAVSAADAEVLACEDFTQWSADGSEVIPASAPGHVNNGLSMSGTGYRRVQSIALSNLGAVDEQATLWVEVDQEDPGWANSIDLIVKLPSASLWWEHIGTQVIPNGSVGTFVPITFPLPLHVQQALSGSYSDLQMLIAINGPANFVVDELSLGTSVGEPPPPPEVETLTFALPAGVAAKDVSLAAADYLRVADGQHVTGLVTNMGNGETNLGAEAVLTGSVYRHGQYVRRAVPLRKHLHVRGWAARDWRLGLL